MTSGGEGVKAFLTLAAVVLCMTATTGFAQNYPTKTIRMVSSDAGGSADLAARPLAQYLTTALGQPVIVDNRAGRVMGGDIVARAAPDGYTVLVQGGVLWIGSLFERTPFDPVRDFVPIVILSRQPSLLVVHPSLPVESVKDLIALARAKPGQLNYAHGSTGSSSHLSGTMFKAMTGVDMVAIPYKGAVQALTDVMSARTQLMFPNAGTAIPLAKAGKLKALAVTSTQPSALMPGMPTVGATVPGFQFEAMTGVFAPARTPDAIIRKLNQESVRYVSAGDTREKLLSAGVEPLGGSPQDASARIRSEVTLWLEIIKKTGVRIGSQ